MSEPPVLGIVLCCYTLCVALSWQLISEPRSAPWQWGLRKARVLHRNNEINIRPQYLSVKFGSRAASGLRQKVRALSHGKVWEPKTLAIVDSGGCSCKEASRKWCDALWVAQTYSSVMTAGSHLGCNLCSVAMSVAKTGSSRHGNSSRHMTDTQKQGRTASHTIEKITDWVWEVNPVLVGTGRRQGDPVGRKNPKVIKIKYLLKVQVWVLVEGLQTYLWMHDRDLFY